ncbi:uncharacterized protein LOC113324684 [Papaver somniferum]|uniref:uncharacterized protein LOC113324684 n=1 Tax=Papaver somniferum TaxID=3469 RepID=UPI000E7049B6|nr:uncharacterized protein LOC113324684 [Papaver somniferum]
MSLMRAYVRVKYGIYLNTSSDEEDKALLMLTQLCLDERLRIIRQLVPREVQTRSVITRDRVWHDAKMMNDYFTPETGYTSRQFKQRLGMRVELFEKLLENLLEVDPEWKQRPDATSTMGYMKFVAVMKCLCKSTAYDSVYDYTRMGATIIYHYLKRFCHTICMTFGERYLREPTPEDVQRFLDENAERGFPRMLGSVDCMQWPWKNCLIAWQETYRVKRNIVVWY